MVQANAFAVAAAALLAALPVHAGLYSKNSPVIQVDGKNYDRLIAQSNYTSVRLSSLQVLLDLTKLLDRRILCPLVRALQESPTRLRKSSQEPRWSSKGSSG
jgi:hypothetical protein